MKKLIKKLCLPALSVAVVLSSFSFTACGHTHVPDTPMIESEVEATCISRGSYDEVTYCAECYEEIDRVTKTTDKAPHTPGEPQREKEVPATCSERGSYVEVITCSVCSDVISRTEKTTDTVPHVYAETLSKDKTGHWYGCTECTDKKDFKKHTPGAAATEASPQLCTVCDYVIAPPVGHIHALTEVKAVEAGCVASGNTAYYTCDCGRWFADSACEVEIENHDSVITVPLGHKWNGGAASGEDIVYTCTVCSETKTTHTYIFEAEYTDLTGLEGKGYSNDAGGLDMIVHDGSGAIGEPGPALASNGFFISYFYKNGLTLTFNIHSDRAVDNARLSMRLSGELVETISLTCDEFEVRVNGSKMKFDDVVITDINTDMSVKEKREFQDFLVSASARLKEGDNEITLTVNNKKKMVGAIGCTAPLIDCIKVQTDARLTWNPLLDNLDRFK